MRRILVRGVFRMPLHTEQPALDVFDRFDQAVRRPTNRDETVTQFVESLVVERRTRDCGGAKCLVHL